MRQLFFQNVGWLESFNFHSKSVGGSVLVLRCFKLWKVFKSFQVLVFGAVFWCFNISDVETFSSPCVWGGLLVFGCFRLRKDFNFLCLGWCFGVSEKRKVFKSLCLGRCFGALVFQTLKMFSSPCFWGSILVFRWFRQWKVFKPLFLGRCFGVSVFQILKSFQALVFGAVFRCFGFSDFEKFPSPCFWGGVLVFRWFRQWKVSKPLFLRRCFGVSVIHTLKTFQVLVVWAMFWGFRL